MVEAVTSALEQRFALAKVIAEKAGLLALDYFNKRETLIIETKRDPQDVVSIADRNVETLIRDEVTTQFGDDGFLGEEYGLNSGKSGYTWVVDPIDGTSPFVHGMPNWCVSIAVLYQDEPVIGVISAPCHHELYAAAKGMGAVLNGKPISVDRVNTLQTGVTAISANSHVTPAFVAGVIERLLEANGNFVRNGSGALMLAYVAAGRLVGFFEGYMHAWDCMAAFCLIEEAGGYCYPFPVDGDNLVKGSPVLAASPNVINALKEVANL
ncbi:inositol monophosphatase family protein [Brucellaceae bacterium C25G]